MTIDWMNPSDDIQEAERIGYSEGLEAQEETVQILQSDNARLRERAEKAEREISRLRVKLDEYESLCGNELERIKRDGLRVTMRESTHNSLQADNERLRAIVDKVIPFPRQPQGDGGWTIRPEYLKALNAIVAGTGDVSLEDIEAVLLAIEKAAKEANNA